MTVFLYTIHVLTCLFLILVVLLQQGKGADLSVFGGGGTMTAFGARGAASLLHKLTVGGFVLFIMTTLTIGVFQSRDAASVMSGIDEEVASQVADEEEEDAAPEAALPEADGPELTDAEADEALAGAADGGDTDAGDTDAGDAGATDAGAGDGDAGDAGADGEPSGQS